MKTAFIFMLVSFGALAQDNFVVSKFMKEIANETPFKGQNVEERCPTILTLEKMSDYLPENMAKGDVAINLRGYEQRGNELDYDYFTHENNRMVIRPSIKDGKKIKIDSSCEFIMGIGCNSTYLSEKNGVLKFEGGVRIISIGMIASSNSSIEYNSKTREITYTFKGNGVEDAVCKYLPDESMKSLVQAFKEKRKNPSVNESGREIAVEKNASPEKKSIQNPGAIKQ